MQRIGGGIANPTEPNAAHASAVLLGRDDDQRLLEPAAAARPVLGSADVGFVDLDTSGEPLAPRSHHGPTQLVEPGPGRLIAAQPQHSLQTQGTHSILLTGDVPHGPEPSDKRQMAILKDGARSDRGLIPAIPT